MNASAVEEIVQDMDVCSVRVLQCNASAEGLGMDGVVSSSSDF